MWPGDPSKIKCCFLDARSPLIPSNFKEPPEPVLSLNGGSDLSMLPVSWLSSQEAWETNQMNSAPFENFQVNTLSDETRELSIKTNPFFSQTLHQGLFDVTTLPMTPENEFTISPDGNQIS